MPWSFHHCVDASNVARLTPFCSSVFASCFTAFSWRSAQHGAQSGFCRGKSCGSPESSPSDTQRPFTCLRDLAWFA